MNSQEFDRLAALVDNTLAIYGTKREPVKCPVCGKELSEETNDEICPNSLYWHGKHAVSVLGSKLDMREVSPDAPRYTSSADRCPTFSAAKPDCQCILRVDHGRKGFVYCQFSPLDRTCGDEQCQFFVRTNSIGTEGSLCGKKTVERSEFCKEHQES
jgi:hypothetical protein